MTVAVDGGFLQVSDRDRLIFGTDISLLALVVRLPLLF